MDSDSLGIDGTYVQLSPRLFFSWAVVRLLKYISRFFIYDFARGLFMAGPYVFYCIL